MNLRGVVVVGLAWAVACAGPDDDEEDTPRPEQDTDTDTDSDTDTATGTDTGVPDNFPDDPSPFTLTVSGDLDRDLMFDTPTCINERDQFRAFWRNSQDDHEFVLLAQVLQDFTGAGTYDETGARTDVKLQEEAGGEGYYFATSADEGDTLLIDLVFANDAVGWGEFTVSALSSGGASVELSPQPIPIWCPDFD